MNEQLESLLQNAVAAAGYQFWGYEYHPQTGEGLLRVYIDSEQGILVDDCAQASHQISALMEVELPTMSQVTLEVSSPGIFRPLFSLSHYQKYLGQKVKIRTREADENNQRNYKGKLLTVEDSTVTVEDEQGKHLLSFDNIEKATLNPDL